MPRFLLRHQRRDGTVKNASDPTSACGASTYKLIRSLVECEKLKSTPYKELVALVANHYDPKPSSIVQMHKFNTRTRQADESIDA